jgi:O-antigen ligase
VRRWHHFTQRPPPLTSTSYINQHFLSTNGNWRYQFWRSTVDEFRTRPVVGRGAGSFEAWWDRTGSGFSSNPHSLLFETLGDLGLVGVITLVAAFGAGVGTALRRTRRAKDDVREASAAALAGFIAFALAAGVEWLWELPAVAAVGVLLLGLALAPEEREAGRATSKGRLGVVVPVGLAAASLAFVAVEVDLHLGNRALSSSQAAAARGDLVAAGDSARTARSYEPWAASPYLQLALIDESARRYTAAHAAIESGLDRQKDDWRLWIVAARIEKHLGDLDSAKQSRDRAVALNPRSAALVSPSRG